MVRKATPSPLWTHCGHGLPNHYRLFLKWCPSHSGIPLNDHVNSLAKHSRVPCTGKTFIFIAFARAAATKAAAEDWHFRAVSTPYLSYSLLAVKHNGAHVSNPTHTTKGGVITRLLRTDPLAPQIHPPIPPPTATGTLQPIIRVRHCSHQRSCASHVCSRTMSPTGEYRARFLTNLSPYFTLYSRSHTWPSSFLVSSLHHHKLRSLVMIRVDIDL